MSLPAWYSQLAATAPDQAALDGVQIDHLRQRFFAQRPAFVALGAQFPTVGEFWDHIGFNVATLDATSYRAGLGTAVAKIEGRQAELALVVQAGPSPAAMLEQKTLKSVLTHTLDGSQAGMLPGAIKLSSVVNALGNQQSNGEISELRVPFVDPTTGQTSDYLLKVNPQFFNTLSRYKGSLDDESGPTPVF